MPSLPHEALLLLFKNRPELAAELLRDVLHVQLPAYREIRADSAELTEVVPTPYHADVVILLIDDKPVFGIIVEAQLGKDKRKPFTWPQYATSLRAKLECPVCVLVLTTSEALAEWARTPIHLGPCGTFSPLVIGPAAVPIVRDVEQAKRDPELAVLSAMAHGKKEIGLEIATAALEACRSLDAQRALLYLDLVGISLSDLARAAFKDLMANHYEFQTDFAKKHKAALDAQAAASRAEGEARGVLKFLDARGITVSTDQKARILACTDIEVLDRWIRKAVTVTTADELFVD